MGRRSYAGLGRLGSAANGLPNGSPARYGKRVRPLTSPMTAGAPRTTVAGMKTPPSRLLRIAIVLALATAAPSALADVPPPDACDPGAVAGDSCDVAGATYDKPGACADETCTRFNPADGGTVEYACMKCKEASGAAGSTGSAGSGSGGGASDDSGCSVKAPARHTSIAGLMIALGAGALFASRRRSSERS